MSVRLYFLVLIFLSAACTKTAASSKSQSAKTEKEKTKDDETTDDTTEGTENEDGQDDHTESPWALNLPLSAAAGLARGDIPLTQDGNSSANQLVIINSNGSSQPITPNALTLAIPPSVLNLTEEDEVSLPPPQPLTVGCIKKTAVGTLIQVTTTENSLPYFLGNTSQLAVIAPSGNVNPIAQTIDSGTTPIELSTSGECASTIQETSDGNIFILAKDQSSIWRIDLATSKAKLFQGIAGMISNILPLDKEHLIISGFDQGQAFSRMLNLSSFAVSDLGIFNNEISNPKAMSAGYGLSVLGSARIGGIVYSIINGSLWRSFVQPIFRFDRQFNPPSSVSEQPLPAGAEVTNIKIGEWSILNRLAIKPTNGKIASNPFWRRQGTYQGIVDHENQIFFDGSNLVKVQYAPEAGLRVTHHKSILQEASVKLKIKGIFGPAQGFTDKWVGFATNEGLDGTGKSYMYWVEIDPVTGQMDSNRIFKISAPNMPAYWYAYGIPSQWDSRADHIPTFTPYKISYSDAMGPKTKIIGLAGTLGASVFDLVFDDSNPASKTLILGQRKPTCDAHTYDHLRALINDDKLFFTASFYDNTDSHSNASYNGSKIYSYDASSDRCTTANPEFTGDTNYAFDPYPIMTNPANRGTCNGGFAYGLIKIPGNTGPSMLYCGSNYKVRLISLSSFNLASSQVISDRELPLVTPGNPIDNPSSNPDNYPYYDTSDNFGDFSSGTDDSNTYLQVLPVSANTLLLGVERREVVRVVDPLNTTTNQLTDSVPFSSIDTEGRREFWHLFATPGQSQVGVPIPAASLLARWDNDTLFAAGSDTSNQQIAWKINLETNERSRILALDGFSTQSGVRLDENKFMVTGTRGSDTSQTIQIILDNSGAKLSEEIFSTNVKEIVDIRP